MALKRSARTFLLALLLSSLAALLTVSVALAHEHREAEGYLFVVGWVLEPAIEGQRNGVDLRVTDVASDEPVEGLEQDLQVEITYLPTQTSAAFSLQPVIRDPGHYTVDLIPTASGEYRFRVFGTVHDTPIDETFNTAGAGGGFNDVEPSSSIQFPEQVPEVRELAGVVRELQSRADAEQDESSSMGGALPVLGLVLGGLGFLAGSAALALGRGRR